MVIETIFFVFVVGYVAFEIQSFVDCDFKVRAYFSERENYFDFIISLLFVAGMLILMYGRKHPKECADIEHGCYTDPLNVSFLIIWASATVLLWLRLCTFCMLSMFSQVRSGQVSQRIE